MSTDKFAMENPQTQQNEDGNKVFENIGTFRKKPQSSKSRHSRINGQDLYGTSSRIQKQSNIFPDSTLRTSNLQSIDEHQPMQTIDEGFKYGATTVTGPEKLSSINIGIFLDRTDIAVGTTSSTKIRDLQVLLAIPATISFVQNKIQIGLPKTEQPQFSVHHLMQKHITSKDNISATNGMSLSPEEILAIFFKKLLLRVSKMRKLPIDSIAFTVTFPTTSLGKERLRQGLAMAGYYNIRILSSALSAGLWFGLYDNHYGSKNREQKFFLVVHTLQDSFSMSIIRVSKTSISTRRCLLSESLSICNENSFKIGHARMFSDDDKNEDQPFAKTVFDAYRTALNQLMTEFGSKQIDRVIGIARSKNDQNLKKILSCFYGDKILTILNSNGPFVGACLLSSRDVLPHTVFPPNIQVTDASRSDLLLLLDSKQLTIIPFKGQKFILGRAATFPVSVTSQGGKLELCEEFPTASVVVAEYSLPKINQEGGKFPRKANCELSVVQDGVFKITARFPEEEDGNILKNILPVKTRFDTQSLAQIKKEFNFEDLSIEKTTEELKYLTKEAVQHYRAILKRLKGKTLEDVVAEHENILKGVENKFREDYEERGIDGESSLPQLRKIIGSVLNNILLTHQQKQVLRWYDDKYLPTSYASVIG